MASRTNPTAFRRQRASDLRLLAETLRRFGVCDDTGPLHSAACHCESFRPNGPDSWGYAVHSLGFNFDDVRGITPADVSRLKLSLSVEASGPCGEHRMEGDPFYTLAVDFCLFGIRAADIPENQLLAAWHLDRHLAGEAPSADAHPLYHFHYGGRRMKPVYAELGRTMLLSAPRLMHPPMDAVLAVDFVLANFAGTRWQALRADSTYYRMVSEAYSRLWRGFLQALVGAWNAVSDSAWERSLQLCPLFCRI